MKKVTFLLATLLIGGMMLTGCKKNDPTPEPEPSTPTTVTVVYKVDKTNGNLVISDCFKLDVTYTNANGQEVTENGLELPWSKSIEVTSPFHAKMQGELVYNEEELPEQVISGKRYGIGAYTNGTLNIEMLGSTTSASKESFLNAMAQHPDRLQFTMEKDF